MALVSREVDPISRIEGHLGVKLTVDDTTNTVTEANVHGNLWRGFENFLIGREINDAITFTQRICGVCPVPHGNASTFAADAVLGYNDCFQTWVAGGNQLSSTTGNTTVPVPAGQGIPEKAVHIRNLVLSAEFLMSHITHSYHLAAPSYVQGPNIPPWTPYFDDSFYAGALLSTGHGIDADGKPGKGADKSPAGADTNGAVPRDVEGFSNDLWSAVIKQYVKALRIRRLTFEAGALFAGRMPMTSCFVAGGVTTDKSENLTTKCTKYRTMMVEIGNFIIQEFVPLFLALGVLYPAWDNVNNPGGQGYGGGVGNFLAWGGFPQTDGTLGSARGYKIGVGGAVQPITKAGVLANLREHIKYSRYEGASQANDNAGVPNPAGVTDPASEDRTIPKRDDAAKYSWLKAPRWNGNPMEVGPMARMFVAGVFQDNVYLRTSVPGYGAYAKTVGAVTGLNPALVAADLAVACVREGVATLTIVDGVSPGVHLVADAAYLVGKTNAQIAAAYANPNAVITGTIAGRIYDLKAGLSTIDRLRARPIEALVLIQKMIGGFTPGTNGLDPISWAGGGWVGQLAAATGDTYISKAPSVTGAFGFGAVEAPRGALMHMAAIDGAGKIVRYQCIVPTTWNAAPKDANDVRGPMEKAMIGIPYSPATTAFNGGAGTSLVAGGGVEALRVAQSFDPCIACAVH